MRLTCPSSPSALLSATLVLLSGCTVFFDTDTSNVVITDDDAADAPDSPDTHDAGAGEVGRDTGDVGPDADDALDVGPDTADDPDTADGPETDAPSPTEPNSCGGARALEFDGVATQPGAACGCGGTLVCNGTDALRCAEARSLNVCGTCRELSAMPGDSCGACDTGMFICDGGELRCEGERYGNLCGGCLPLDGAPGAPCEGPSQSLWVCEEENLVECRPVGAQNGCGGAGPLEYGGLEASPGEACEAECGEGRLVCDVAANALRCDGPTRNVCGGCGELTAQVGAVCGCESRGRWSCDETAGDVVCVGGDVNACGGCAALSQQPGAACSGGRVRLCNGRDATLCLATGATNNACGGVDALRDLPGTPCGSCASGVYSCADPESTTCVGDRGAAAFNACGGCNPLSGAVDDACGVCALGRVVCEGQESLRCDGNPGPTGRNACGGCAALAGAPESACGTCAVWRCAGGDVQCVADVGDPACGERPLTCDDLGCSEQNRVCTAGVDGGDAACGGCVPGRVERGGACLLPLTCDERGCADANRVCVETSGSDAECDGCVDGHEERGGNCVAVAVECTEDGDCSSQLGDWSECAWSSACAEQSQRSREVTPRVCSANRCLLGTTTLEYEDCAPRSTDGDPCGSGSVCVDGACLGTPAAPAGVQATNDLPDRVTVTWSTVPGATAYEVDIGFSETWTSVGAATRFDDTTAPAPTIAVCSGGDLTASQGTHASHVELSCTGASANVAAARTYRVRARNAAGAGAQSIANGRRAPGALTYQWRRATTSGGTYSDLSGATSSSHNDTGAPSDGSVRWYRVVLSAEGASSATSASVSGYRSSGSSSGLGASCSTSAQCLSGQCSVHVGTGATGRCAPAGFSYIPSGSFVMGSPNEEPGRASSETLHSVTITRPFFLQQAEVTQSEWRSLVGNNPSYFNRNGGCTTESDCPVEQVNWWEAVAYANLVSANAGLSEPDHCYVLGSVSGSSLGSGCTGDSSACSTGTYARGSVTFRGPGCRGYRLPTEAEWEYAYRAGTTTAFYGGPITETGSGLDPSLNAIGHYAYNSEFRTNAARGKLPNAWNLYDMSGNVWEWVWDAYSASYYSSSPTSDPLGPSSSSNRVTRGGSWESDAQHCRAAAREVYFQDLRYNYIGFRLARVAPS